MLSVISVEEYGEVKVKDMSKSDKSFLRVFFKTLKKVKNLTQHLAVFIFP